jgi:hypothetical protein
MSVPTISKLSSLTRFRGLRILPPESEVHAGMQMLRACRTTYAYFTERHTVVAVD